MKQLLLVIFFFISTTISSADIPDEKHLVSTSATGYFPLRACRMLCNTTTVAEATILLAQDALNCTCDTHQKKYCTQRLMQIIMSQKYSPDLIPLYLDCGVSATAIDCFKGTPLKYLIASAYEYEGHLDELKAKFDFIFSRLNNQEIVEYTQSDAYINVNTLCYHKGIRYLESMLKADLHKEEYCIPYVLLSEEIASHRVRAFKESVLTGIAQQKNSEE